MDVPCEPRRLHMTRAMSSGSRTREYVNRNRITSTSDMMISSAFIPASCFQPPRPSSAQPRGWDRVAVPASTSRHTESKIYKRVGALVHVDNKYLDAVNELESQGFGSRKRVRSQTHIPPYGNASSEREDESQIPGEQELSTARGEQKRIRYNLLFIV